MPAIRHNAALSRYEMDTEGGVAFANYRRAGERVIITHTETPAALRGRGLGGQLVEGVLQSLRADGLKVIAGCGFVAQYLREHPEWRDLQAG